MSDLRSDSIRDILFDSDIESDLDNETNVEFISELNENIQDPVFDSESEGELDDEDKDPDFFVNQTQILSESEDDPDDFEVGRPITDPQPSTSTGRPSLNVGNRLQTKRKRSSQVGRPSDDELGWVNDDTQPNLPLFDESNSGIKAGIDETSTPIDIFPPLKKIPTNQNL